MIRSALLLVALLLPATLITGCGSLSGAGAPSVDGSLGELPGDWRVMELHGEMLVDGAELSLSFDEDGAFSGESGVNRLRATYTETDGGLVFSPVLATRMAGRPELMEQEELLLDALERTRSFTLRSGRLGLIDGAGITLLAARRR